MNKLKNYILAAGAAASMFYIAGCGQPKWVSAKSDNDMNFEAAIEDSHQYWASLGVLGHTKEQCVESALKLRKIDSKTFEGQREILRIIENRHQHEVEFGKGKQ